MFTDSPLLSNDGNGVNLELSRDLTISDGAIISVSNFPSLEGIREPGTGEAGNLTVEADSLSIENGGIIDAATQAGNGGNITLDIAEDITLENTALISARALKDANGGNVNINTNLIIAFQGNNDIIATAQRGNGGNINISAESLFGIQQRPLNNSTNDINASSEFSLDGTVEIDNPAVDPATGLINLPASVGDASDQISQNPCQQGVGSEFIVTGKGGLPRHPVDSLNSNEVRVGLVGALLGRDEETRGQGREAVRPRVERKRRDPAAVSAAKERAPSQGTLTKTGKETVSISKRASENQVPEAVPAMGWVFNDEGEVTLTAYQYFSFKN